MLCPVLVKTYAETAGTPGGASIRVTVAGRSKQHRVGTIAIIASTAAFLSESAVDC